MDPTGLMIVLDIAAVLVLLYVITAMPSLRLTSSFPPYPPLLDWCGFVSPSDSGCGSTTKPSSTEDPWGDSGTSTLSGKLGTTLPTKNSLNPMTKHDPSHYKRGSIEVWDFIVDQQLDYLAGNCVKYVCRAGHKNHETELDDWLKVRAYVERKILSIQQNRNR